jgi:uncharacterized protein YgiM (DUF1202 family)
MDGRRIGAFLVLIGSVTLGYAAEPPAKYSGTIIFKEIEMRAGPSLKYPQTGALQKGEQVLIAKEEEKWYAILPPSGSVSWVNHLFLGKYDPALQGKQNAVIMKDNVPVRILGEFELDSTEKNRTPVVQMKLSRGTIVEIIGPKRKIDDSTWYPIKPPVGEYRYIPKFAVGNLKEMEVPVSVAKNNVQVGNVNEKDPPTPSNNTTSTTTAKVNHPSWGEAELLQSRGQFAEAERIYTQIYQELKNKKADLDDLLTCLNRIDDCRQKVKPATSSSIPRESTSRSASLENPTFRPSQPPPPQTRKDWPTSRVAEDQNRNPEPDRGNFKSTGNGMLRRTPFLIDNKQAYALEKERGDVLYYVTAQSGINLDGYLNKRVELLGTEQVRGDVRGAPYMVVSKVNPVK